MKIVVTGSLGNISKPLTKELVQKGHAVTVISSKPEKQAAIEALGATAAIGTLEDVKFLTATFTGADAVYCMLPPFNYFDPNLDIMATTRRLVGNYAKAIRESGVKHVVHLSSIGAHLEKGNGVLAFHHLAENILRELPSDVAIVHMRPTGFYNNLYDFIGMIKASGFIAANYGADDRIVWVSPSDIASAIAEEIETPPVSRKVRYVASNELTCNEVASILGEAIGKPDLKWIIIPSEQMQSGLEAVGIPQSRAEGIVEMNAGMHSGLVDEDYYRNRPKVMGKVKMKDFAKEFAAAFKQN